MKIFVIPDVQAHSGTDITHLIAAGKYAVEKKPDVIVCLGDFADMPSLSSYEKAYLQRNQMLLFVLVTLLICLLLAPMRRHIFKETRCYCLSW